MNPFIEISGRKIGYDFEPLVIAEIGINHEGSLEVAKNMVDAAAKIGVEIIKHQTHILEDEMSKASINYIPGNSNESIYEIMKRCSLNEEDEWELKQYTESKGMIFISTPFSRKAAERLHSWDVPAYKIGSGECNNYPLLNHISSFGKPIILSTGMNTIQSINKAVEIFRNKSIPFALLHTTNLYPTPDHLVRLGAVSILKNLYSDAVIGLSDHTLTNHACFGAVSLGASILERHFTDSMDRPGPDIICSMDPKACSELIHGVKILSKQRGGDKNPVDEEQVTMNFAFSTICSMKAISKGEIFSKENIWVKRPGNGGILAEHFESVLGKKSKVNIGKDEQIQWDQIV